MRIFWVVVGLGVAAVIVLSLQGWNLLEPSVWLYGPPLTFLPLLFVIRIRPGESALKKGLLGLVAGVAVSLALLAIFVALSVVGGE